MDFVGVRDKNRRRDLQSRDEDDEHRAGDSESAKEGGRDGGSGVEPRLHRGRYCRIGSGEVWRRGGEG